MIVGIQQQGPLQNVGNRRERGSYERFKGVVSLFSNSGRGVGGGGGGVISDFEERKEMGKTSVSVR